MAKVKIAKGYVKSGDGIGKSHDTLESALAEQGKCDSCGCDSTLGFMTLTNAETGELMMLYVTGTGEQGDEYTLNIADHATGLAAVKDLCSARNS